MSGSGCAAVAGPQDAFVVFSGETGIRWLRWLLRPGFRHCFVVWRDGARWVSFDPLAHRTEILVHDLPDGFDLPGWLAGQGHTLARARFAAPPPRPAPLMPMSCVEAVKRVLGLHSRRIVTPWQLYRHLVSPPHYP